MYRYMEKMFRTVCGICYRLWGTHTHTHTHTIYSLQNELVLTAPRVVTIASRLLEVGKGACSFWTHFWYL